MSFFDWKFVRANRYILSPQDYKRVLLVSRLTLIFLIAQVCFSIIDIINGYWLPLPYLAISIAGTILVLFLNAKGYHGAAKIMLAILVNLIAIYFTAAIIRDLGIFIFSICINIGIMAIFGQHDMKYAVPIIVISTLLFLAAMFHPYERMPVPDEPYYVLQNLGWTFIIANTAAITIVYYFVKINRLSESMLLKKENILSKQNNELGRINAELDKFFYSVSHDVRAPLTSIQGLIHLIEKSNDLDEVKTYVNLLKGRANNLDEFITKVSEYARSGRQAIVAENINLKQVVREALENLRFMPRAEEVNVSMDVPETIIVSSDMLRLQIIFSNLLSNAFKYHDYHKPKPFLRIQAIEKNDMVLITIQDNGMGIQQENLKNIFEMFFRANHKVQGSGLGLYIVKEALDKIGGTIHANSEYGAGTQFEISLPKKMPHES